MRFADISGHDDVKQRLRDMVDENRLPWRVLFCSIYTVRRVLPATVAAVAPNVSCRPR